MKTQLVILFLVCTASAFAQLPWKKQSFDSLDQLKSGGPPAAQLAARFVASSLVLSDSNFVTTWTDSSGNGHDATGPATTAPLYRNNVTDNINGKPVVNPDGADDFLTMTNYVGLTNNWTVHAIGRRSASGDVFLPVGNSSGRTLVTHFSDNKSYIFDEPGSSDISTGSWATNGVHQWTWRMQGGTNSIFYIDNVAKETNVTGIGGMKFAGLFIQTANNQHSKGYFAEILMYSKFQDTSELSAVHTYSQSTYGTP